MKKIPLLVICGPTGSGKTSLALKLAEHYPLEAISADSRQVYRQMDIGTAKVTAAEQQRLPHHLIDLIDPDQEFSVSRFVDLARPLITKIDQCGQLPCVVGGTGLYIQALTGGLADLPSADQALRQQLHQQEREQGSGSLHRRLAEVDPPAAAAIHPNNLIRTVRALEVWLLSGKRFSDFKAEHAFGQQDYRVLQLAPEWPREELYRRIDRRVDEMLKQGFLDEVRALLQRYPADLKAFETLGYREAVAHLQGLISGAEMREAIARETRRYAKRQLTWFRRQAEIIWVDSLRDFGKVITYIDNFLTDCRC